MSEFFNFKTASSSELKTKFKEISQESGDDGFFTKKELNHLPSVLMDEEQVLALSSGLMDGNTWLISLTDKRIVLLDKGLLYGLRQKAIDLEKVTAIEGKTGILFGKIVIHVSSAEYKIDQVPKPSVTLFANKCQTAIERLKKKPEKEAIAQTAVHPKERMIEMLERLEQLQARGVITPAEFSEQKRAILQA